MIGNEKDFETFIKPDSLTCSVEINGGTFVVVYSWESECAVCLSWPLCDPHFGSYFMDYTQPSCQFTLLWSYYQNKAHSYLLRIKGSRALLVWCHKLHLYFFLSFFYLRPLISLLSHLPQNTCFFLPFHCLFPLFILLFHNIFSSPTHIFVRVENYSVAKEMS